MLYATFGIVGAVAFYLFFFKKRRISYDDKDGESSKAIPGPRKLPFIGNVLDINKERMQCSFYNWMTEYGPVFKISFLSQELVIINDPTLMRDVFSELIHRPDSLPNELNFKRSGVTLTNFEGHQETVKQITWRIFQETFRDPRIRELEDDILDEFIDYLISQSDGTLDVDKAILTSIATQLSAEITGNKPTVEIVDASLAYFSSVVNLFAEGRALLLTLYSWLKNIPGKNKTIVQTNIKAKSHVAQLLFEDAKKTYKKGDELGMLHRFMSRKEEENTKAGFELIKDENLFASCIIDVIGGGFRGTSAAISSSVLYMLLYPEIREKLNEEIVKIRGVKKIRDVVEKDLPYLNAFIMESIRLSSIIYVTLPHHVDKDVTIAGYRFKENQSVLGGLWNVHHAQETWGDPFTFRPERFLDQSGNVLPTSHPLRQAFIPFSVGIRDCKGKHTAMDKVFRYVSRMLYRCEITPVADKELPSGDPRTFRSVVALFLPTYFCTFVERV